MKKIVLITGITGQDGSYLTEFLMGKGYEVQSDEQLAKDEIALNKNLNNLSLNLSFFKIFDISA